MLGRVVKKVPPGNIVVAGRTPHTGPQLFQNEGSIVESNYNAASVETGGGGCGQPSRKAARARGLAWVNK